MKKYNPPMLNFFIMIISLFLSWFVFSGIAEPFFIIAGIISVLAAFLISSRMGVIDSALCRTYLRPKAFLYYIWLIKEIFFSAVDVTKKVWKVDMDISPSFSWIDTEQADDVARTIYANSITLTPGTVSVDVEDKKIRVHALTKETMSSLKSGYMDKRVSKGFRCS